MQRTEAPTQEKLQNLREAGLTPYSSYASRCMALLILLIGFFVIGKDFKDFAHQVAALLKSASFSDLKLQEVLFKLSYRLLLIPAILVFLATLVGGMLQTRFLVKPSLVAPLPGRLNPFSGLHARTFLYEASIGLGLVIGSGILAALLFRLFVTDILGLLTLDKKSLLLRPEEMYEAALPIFIPLIAFSGFLAWLVAHFRFMIAHRMAREEVLHEHEDRQ